MGEEVGKKCQPSVRGGGKEEMKEGWKERGRKRVRAEGRKIGANLCLVRGKENGMKR